MTIPASPDTTDQGGIRRRFALLLFMVGLPIVALIAILAWRSYNQAYDTVVEQIGRDLKIRQSGLEQLAADTHSHVAMLKAFAESQLATRAGLAEYAGPFDWPGSGTDPGPNGGLVMAPPGSLTASDRQEIAAISALFPMLRAAHRARDYLRWSYYFPASQKYVAIYPWAPVIQMLQGSSPEAALESYFAYDIYSMATPPKNAEREPYWTPVYFDAGGSGLMVSHGSPVYDGQRFAGMAGTDILLSHIGDFLGKFPPFAGDVVLIDQNGAVAALPGKAPNDGKSPILASTIIGDVSGISQDGRIVEHDQYLTGAAAIAGTPWKLLVRTDRGAARAAALASIQPLAAILSAIIIMLGALTWLFRNQFVAPAVALVNFASRGSETSTSAPVLPLPFQPLLASLQQSRVKNEEYLRQMRAMIDNMPLRVGYVDNQLIYQDINQRLLDFLGLKREEVIGKSLEEILGPAVAAQYQEILPRVMKGETVQWEGWAEFPTRGRHYLHRLVMPFAPDGGPPGTLTFTQDTTDSELAAQALAEKEALNRAVVSGARDAIVVMDEHGTALQWNPAAEEIFGFTAAEAIGQKVSDLIVPEAMREMHQKGMERYLATGEAAVLGKRLELQGLRKDGNLVPIELTITESRIEGRRLFTSHLRDITQQKAAEADLQRTRATLQSIFDNVPAQLYVRELDGTIVLMNKWGAEQIGKSEKELIGSNVRDLQVDDEVPAIRRAQEQLLETGGPVTGEFLIRYAKRQVRGLTTIFPIKDAEGTIVRIGGVIFDIEDRMRAEEQLHETRATLQSIFDNVPADLYLRDVDGTFVMMNKWGAEQRGLTPEEFVGRNVSEFRRKDEVQAGIEAERRLLETGRPVTGEFQIQYSGKVATGLSTIFPVRNQDGKITRIGGVIIDVTELRQTSKKLEEARSLITSIFDNAPLELYLRDLDGTYVMMNKWGANYVGVEDPQDMVGQSFTKFDAPDEIERSFDAQSKLMDKGEPVTREFNYRMGEKTMTLQNTIFPVRNAAGEIDRIGGVSIDVTALNQARDQLQRAQENLHQSEKLAALGQLLAGVAHELNNPLAVVLGRAAMLQEKLKDTPHAAPLQKLREAADRCTRIVKTFLAMARQTGPRREAVDVNEIIESALEMTTYSLRKHNVVFNTLMLEGNHMIEADEDQIVQVLINLILNAQQALQDKPDTRLLNVSAEICPDRQRLGITVADNGPGVPDAIASRIFDPFFTTKPVGEGTGLGLSVCKGMVEAHGGKLVYEATPGGGATFRIELPLTANVAAAPGNANVLGSRIHTRGRVLVVDDEVEIAAILADCLSPLGIECVIASDGKVALEHIETAAFDGIFCDVSMPGMDGLTFYKILRSRNPLLANRLVFISGDVLHRDWAKLKATAGRPIIEKPFDPQTIRDEALRLLQEEGSKP